MHIFISQQHIPLPRPRPFLSVATANRRGRAPAIMCRTSKAIAPRLAWAETTLGPCLGQCLAAWANGTGMNYHRRSTSANGISDPTMTMINAISRLSASLLTELNRKTVGSKLFVEALREGRARPRPTAG